MSELEQDKRRGQRRARDLRAMSVDREASSAAAEKGEERKR